MGMKARLRDIHTSLQWAVLLFNVFFDCSAHETLEKYLSKKFKQKTVLCKINLGALYSGCH